MHTLFIIVSAIAAFVAALPIPPLIVNENYDPIYLNFWIVFVNLLAVANGLLFKTRGGGDGGDPYAQDVACRACCAVGAHLRGYFQYGFGLSTICLVRRIFWYMSVRRPVSAVERRRMVMVDGFWSVGFAAFTTSVAILGNDNIYTVVRDIGCVAWGGNTWYFFITADVFMLVLHFVGTIFAVRILILILTIRRFQRKALEHRDASRNFNRLLVYLLLYGLMALPVVLYTTVSQATATLRDPNPWRLGITQPGFWQAQLLSDDSFMWLEYVHVVEAFTVFAVYSTSPETLRFYRTLFGFQNRDLPNPNEEPTEVPPFEPLPPIRPLSELAFPIDPQTNAGTL